MHSGSRGKTPGETTHIYIHDFECPATIYTEANDMISGKLKVSGLWLHRTNSRLFNRTLPFESPYGSKASMIGRTGVSQNKPMERNPGLVGVWMVLV